MIFFKKYFEKLDSCNRSINSEKLVDISEKILKLPANQSKIIIIGNGGSAAIASHVAVDFTKAAGIRATTFNESSLLTCFSNDYGYDHWVEKAIESYADKNDLVILISSSGQSKNIINGAIKAKELNLQVITLSGFMMDNPLRGLGDINMWVDSKSYNIVEITHQTWLLSIVDYLVENGDK